MAYSSAVGSGPRPLTIGSYTFLSEECPTRLPIGALEHTYVETLLYGGGKVTHSIGAQPKPVTWSGVFRQGFTAKFTTFRNYALSGQELLLAYGDEKWYCKVKTIDPDLSYLEAGYSIQVIITRGASGQLDSPTTVDANAQVTTLANGALSDVTVVSSLDPSSIAANLKAQSAALAATVPTIGPITSATGANVKALLAQAQSLTALVSTYASTVDSLDPRFLPVTSALDKLTNLASNITSIQRASSVTVYGGSLTAVAAQYCGSAARAFDIASANGLYSLKLPKAVPTVLYIPNAIRNSSNIGNAARP